MSPKEAIEIIKTAQAQIEWDLPLDYAAAFDMAIEALENSPTQMPGVSDLISRQAAIDTEGLDEQIRCEMCRNPMHTGRGCDGCCQYDEKLYKRIMQILDERIKPLPSAQPERKTGTSDPISRDEAIDAMTNTLWHYPNECYRNLNEYEFAKGLAELGLKSVPSAQPEIIHCKDCSFVWKSDEGSLWCDRLSGCFHVVENAFCSFAKGK